jgi:hypothetical protein
MAGTAFNALDQERLPKEEWDLADSFARLPLLASGHSVDGVVRITAADLWLALDDRWMMHG